MVSLNWQPILDYHKFNNYRRQANCFAIVISIIELSLYNCHSIIKILIASLVLLDWPAKENKKHHSNKFYSAKDLPHYQTMDFYNKNGKLAKNKQKVRKLTAGIKN